jgi:hypothetical protein
MTFLRNKNDKQSWFPNAFILSHVVSGCFWHFLLKTIVCSCAPTVEEQDVFKQYLRDLELARVAHLLSLSHLAAHSHIAYHSLILLVASYCAWILHWFAFPLFILFAKAMIGRCKPGRSLTTAAGVLYSNMASTEQDIASWFHFVDGIFSCFAKIKVNTYFRSRKARFELELVDLDELKEKRYSHQGHKVRTPQCPSVESSNFPVETPSKLAIEDCLQMLTRQVFMQQLQKMNKSASDPNIRRRLSV